MKLTIGLGLLALLLAGGLALYTPDSSRATLEARYLASPADVQDIAGQQLHVRDTGPRNAPAVVLIHGLGAHLQTWNGWSSAMEKDFRVIRFDLPGHGLSPPDVENDYRDSRSIKLLVGLLDKLEIRRASIIGNSIGGRIAWKFAAAHPDKVTSLVLVSPDGFASPGFEYGKAAEVPAYLDVMKYVLPEAMLRANIEVAYSNPAKLSDDVMRRYYDLFRAPGARGALLERMRQTVQVPPEPMLAKIDVPVLLLWGENDQMIPLANAQDYKQALADARLATLPNLGHLPQEEDAQKSIGPVLAFLRAQTTA